METLTQTTDAATTDTDTSGFRDAVRTATMADRLITWVTIGGLALGTYGTFHAVTTLTFGTSPADRALR